MTAPTKAEWDALTDLHCSICGPEPASYTLNDEQGFPIPWSFIWLHDRCKPEHDRRQREAIENVRIS